MIALALNSGSSSLKFGLSAYGSKRWTESMRTLTSRLDAARVDEKTRPPPSPATFDSRELEGLPAPVQRYFRAALKAGQPIIGAGTLELDGTINLSAAVERWKPFTSRQRIVTRRPGFLWDARVSMLPGVVVRVVDSYIAGEGLLRAAVLGLFPVADARGGGELARGEFMRFFPKRRGTRPRCCPARACNGSPSTTPRRRPPSSMGRST